MMQPLLIRKFHAALAKSPRRKMRRNCTFSRVKSRILQRQPRGAFPSFVCFSFCAQVRSPEEPIRAILHAQSAKKPQKKDRPVQTTATGAHWWRQHWSIASCVDQSYDLKVWFGVIFKFGEGSYCRRDNMFQRSVNTDSTRLKGQQLKKHFCLFFFPTCQSQILPVFSVKLQSFIIDTAVWDRTLVMMPPFIYTAPASTSEATVGRRFSSWLQDKDQIIKWSYNLLITRLVSLNYDDIICRLSNSSRTVRLWGCR